jgi:hypothetical protein
MSLRPYASRPARLALQLLADASVLVWIYVWYRVGRLVHDSLTNVAAIGYNIDSNAGRVAGSLTQAGDSASQIPLLGGQVGGPITDAGKQVAGIAASGRNAGDQLTSAAMTAGWLVALVPIVLVVVPWLVLRLRYARRAGTLSQLATAPAGVELLALRALAHQPLPALTRVSDDPVRAWRDGEIETTYALAQLELDDAGVPWPDRRARRAAAIETARSGDAPQG